VSIESVPITAADSQAPDDRSAALERAGCEHMADFRETFVYRWLAAGDAGDLDAFDGLLLPDAVIHTPRGLSTTSREAEKAVWQQALAASPTFATTFKRFSLAARSRWPALW
jgi:hypothetical protein